MNDLGPHSSNHAIALCSATIQAHSKSFALASKLLPQPARDEAVVLYAWCRRADDAVDDAPPGTAPTALRRLSEELESIYANRTQRDPVLAAFQSVVQRRSIPQHYPQELLNGMAMDVQGYSYANREDLLLYCYRVASVVGLMMCHVMGIRRPDAVLKAAHLGAAMQLTNICRDVVEDWNRGRVYLPENEIKAVCPDFEPPRTIEAPIPDHLKDTMTPVVENTLRWADSLYKSGAQGAVDLNVRSAFAILAARHIYADIGRVLKDNHCDVTRGRAYTTKARKLVLVGRSLVGLCASMPIRLFFLLTGRGRYKAPSHVLTFETLFGGQRNP